VPALIREMGQAYPELVRGEALITETLKLEETRFRKTLARGLGLLADATETLGSGDMLDGETAFKLYDTYGFPLDLTQDALRQREHFGGSRRLHRCDGAPEGRGARELGGLRRQGDRVVWFSVREKTGATEFLGYETEQAEGVDPVAASRTAPLSMP
jgi:alanyl-tRNA synthetase